MFRQQYGGPGPKAIAVAPGRVNLIGEHTDYNAGFVLPMAIERHVAVAFSAERDATVRIWSEHFEEEIVFRVDELAPGRIEGWGAYPAGMCWAMRQRGYPVKGMSAAISANVPIGAGVSSSAALEVSFGLALSAANGLDLQPEEIAALSHVADNEFVGIPSGIMDQFASALCLEGHALLIDCRTAKAESVPVPDGVVFVVMDTGKRRGLVDSEYSARVAACARVVGAARLVREHVTALRDLSMDELRDLQHSLDPLDYNRAVHVVNENARTLSAVDRFRAGDVHGFGQLMIGSHNSLRDLYEVSCSELDIAVEAALVHPGCIGARMTGGGFGGCALALVESSAAEEFIQKTSSLYSERAQRNGAFFAVKPTAGARLIINRSDSQ